MNRKLLGQISHPLVLYAFVAHCLSQIRSWALLYKLYTDDNNGFFPEG